jgi:hypothetical protein
MLSLILVIRLFLLDTELSDSVVAWSLSIAKGMSQVSISPLKVPANLRVLPFSLSVTSEKTLAMPGEIPEVPLALPFLFPLALLCAHWSQPWRFP